MDRIIIVTPNDGASKQTPRMGESLRPFVVLLPSVFLYLLNHSSNAMFPKYGTFDNINKTNTLLYSSDELNINEIKYLHKYNHVTIAFICTGIL